MSLLIYKYNKNKSILMQISFFIKLSGLKENILHAAHREYPTKPINIQTNKSIFSLIKELFSG